MEAYHAPLIFRDNRTDQQRNPTGGDPFSYVLKRVWADRWLGKISPFDVARMEEDRPFAAAICSRFPGIEFDTGDPSLLYKQAAETNECALEFGCARVVLECPPKSGLL